MIWAVATNCFPKGCEAITHFHLVPSLRMSSTMPILYLCAIYKDIFVGLGTGKYNVDIYYKMGVFKRMFLQFGSHFVF